MLEAIKISKKIGLALGLLSIFVLQISVMAQDKVRQIDELMSQYRRLWTLGLRSLRANREWLRS